MKVLVACEFSGRVRQAFAELGHDAWSCDLRPTEIPGQHIQGDVLEVLENGWDLMIGHPCCRYLSLSGVRWLKGNPGRQESLEGALRFFRRLWEASIPRIALENPMSLAVRVAPKSQVIHPYQFGHAELKTTWLWLKGLPPLVPTCEVFGPYYPAVHRSVPGPEREKDRSRTYSGIAKAMAAQWGCL